MLKHRVACAAACRMHVGAGAALLSARRRLRRRRRRARRGLSCRRARGLDAHRPAVVGRQPANSVRSAMPLPASVIFAPRTTGCRAPCTRSAEIPSARVAQPAAAAAVRAARRPASAWPPARRALRATRSALAHATCPTAATVARGVEVVELAAPTAIGPAATAAAATTTARPAVGWCCDCERKAAPRQPLPRGRRRGVAARRRGRRGGGCGGACRARPSSRLARCSSAISAAGDALHSATFTALRSRGAAAHGLAQRRSRSRGSSSFHNCGPRLAAPRAARGARCVPTSATTTLGASSTSRPRASPGADSVLRRVDTELTRRRRRRPT